MTPKSPARNFSFKFAFLLFTASGLLALLLVASFGTDWGIAYGQTAGPTVTSTSGNTPLEPTPASIPGPGSGGTASPIIPGFPNTGSATPLVEKRGDAAWQIATLAGLGLLMLGSALLMRRAGKKP